MPLQPNDRVNWRYTPRGGYGWSTPVAAVVLRLMTKKARIRVAQKIGGTWELVEKTVEQSSLTPRTTNCAELGE